MSHSSLPVALLASHPPCGSLWAAPKAPLGPRFPSGQFAALTRREKALHCPFCRRGSQRRTRHSWRIISFVCARSCARLFPPSKWTGLFPSAAYLRSAPPQLARGRLNQCELGYCIVAWWLRSATKWAWLLFSTYLIHLKQHRLGCFNAAWIFLQHKRPAWFHLHAGLCCKPEGLSPDGGLFYSTSKEATPNRRAVAPVVPRQ